MFACLTNPEIGTQEDGRTGQVKAIWISFDVV